MTQAPWFKDGLIRPRVYYALTQGAFGIYLPFIYVYLEQERQLTGRQIGILAAIAPLMTLLVAPVWAALADLRGSRLQTLRWAVAGAAASILLVGLPRHFLIILFLLVFYNFFQVAIVPLGDGILASTASRRNIPYGNLRLWGSFGFALAGITFGQVGRRLGLGALFPACALLFLLAVPVAWKMVRREPPPPKHPTGSTQALIKDRAIIQFLIVAGLAAVGITAGYTFLYVFLGSLGASAGLIGAVSAIGALVEAPFMLWGGRLIRRHSAPTLFAAGMGLFCLGWALYAILRQPWLALPVQLLNGAGMGLLWPACVTYIEQRAPSQQTATAQSLLSAVMYGIAPLLANLLAGNVFDMAGARMVLAIASAIMASGIILFIVTRKRMPDR